MNLAMYLDSTNLKPEATANDIRKLCLEAAKYKMAAVCIQPYRLSLARELLAGSGVKLCTVIGFPFGAEGLKSKLFMAEQALENGANELDMVINVGALKDGDFNQVQNEIKALAEMKRQKDFILKAIVETALLEPDELINVIRWVGDSGADFIKTSTGYSTRGASIEDVKIMAAHRKPGLKIKASGGIKKLDQALQLIAAGADRLGSSSAVSILEEERLRGGR